MMSFKKSLLFLAIAMLVFACPAPGAKLVTGIEISPTSVEILEGQTSTLTATILPEDAENKNVVWSTSDDTKVQVNNGVISAVKEGSATITVASEENGTIKATCEVTVVKDTSIKKIELKDIPTNINYGSEFELTDDKIIYSPIGTPDIGFTVEFEPTDILEYNKDTKKVTTKAPGTTRMKVISSMNTKLSHSIDIKVEKYITDFDLSDVPTTIVRGTHELFSKVKLVPEDTTDTEFTVTSSATDVIAVSASGKIIAVKDGSTTLTFTSKTRASVSKTLTVTVSSSAKTDESNWDIIYRDGKYYELTKGYKLESESEYTKSQTTVLGSIADGTYKVNYSTYTGSMPSTSSGKLTFTLPENTKVDYVEIRAKLSSVASGFRPNIGIDSWKYGLIRNTFQGTVGNGFAFRMWDGGNDTPKFNPFVANTYYTFGMKLRDTTTPATSTYIFNGDTVVTKTIAGIEHYVPLKDKASYTIYIGGDNDLSVAGDVDIDYIAFYKEQENSSAIQLPSGENLKREDSAIIVPDLYDEVNKTAVSNKDVDLFSGADAFKLYYQDNFNYASTDAFWAKEITPGKKAWKKNENFNLSTKGVRIENNELVLSVLRVANTSAVSGRNGFENGFTQNEVDRSNTKGGHLAGGLDFGEEFFYGYLEAELKVVTKSYSGFWCGFYTYGTRSEDGKSIAGYEFDIYEQPTNGETHVVTHWPWAITNEGESYRVATAYKALPTTDYINKFIKVSVAWTPEKVVYYINDNIITTLYEDKVINTNFTNGNIQAIKNANNSPRSASNSKYQTIANIPQWIKLVIAANGTSGYSGSEPVITNAPHGYSFDFIYYRNFKLYKYVGKVIQ